MTFIKNIYFSMTTFLLFSVPVVAMINTDDDIQGNCFYTIKNRALGNGSLSYTDKRSASGRYVQHLHLNKRNKNNYYNTEKQHYEPGGKWENSVRWYISPSEKKGYYTIRNCDIGYGYLGDALKNSADGRYVQHLHTGSCYDNKKELYKPGELHRNSVLWAISPSERNGFYTIRSCNSKLKTGYLSYTDEESASGHYVQHLCTGTNYDNEKQLYEPGGSRRNRVLWELRPENYSLKAVIKDFVFTTDPVTILSQNKNKNVMLMSKMVIKNNSSAELTQTIDETRKTTEIASLSFQKSKAMDFIQSSKNVTATAEVSSDESKDLHNLLKRHVKVNTSEADMIEWNCNQNAQTSRLKTFTGTTTHRIRQIIKAPANTSMEIYYTISRSSNISIPFTASIEITAFADRLNTNGRIERGLPVNLDLLKFFLKREGYHAPIFRTVGNTVYVTVNGALRADVGFDTLFVAKDI